MTATITTLPYFGQIQGIISQDNISLLITRNSTSDNTSLYRLDSQQEQPTMTALSLPIAMDGLCAMTDSTVILIGHDSKLYQTDWQAKKIQAISDSVFESGVFDSTDDTIAETAFLPSPTPTAVAIAEFGNAVAVLYPHHLLVWQYHNHKLGELIATINLATLTSPTQELTGLAPATTLATSADGEWLVVGDEQGKVTSFFWQNEQTELALSSSETLHQGAITALCFEPIAQQFFSAGADKQLLRTHVQGKLQGIDRGKASQHTEMIRAMCVSPTRLYTGSDDKSVKSWVFDKGQPNTCKEDLAKVRFLSVASYLGQASVLVAGTDQSLRFIAVDNEGKLGTVAHIIKDGYQRLSDWLSDSDDKVFKDGIKLLNQQNDAATLSVVAKLLENNKDGYRSEQLAIWVANSQLPKTTHQLEQLLNHAVENVRTIAFMALQQHANRHANPLRYLQLALDSKFIDVNAKAIDGYLAMAQAASHLLGQILPILQHSLTHKDARIGNQALQALETLLPADSPRADLLAVASGHSQMQQTGLIRLYQRGFLQNFEVKRQLVLLQTDNDMRVRQTAFYMGVLSQPTLAKTLARLDEAFTRTLQDFDDFQLIPRKTKQTVNGDNANQSVDLSLTFTTDKLEANDKQTLATVTLSATELEPLLQGLSNPHTDISFRASYALALLQDERAIGALMRLMYDNDVQTRIGVAKAFAKLGQRDGLSLLPILLDDSDANVRNIAMQAYGNLCVQHQVSLLQWARVGFASREQDVHQQALSVLLTALKDPTMTASADAITTLTQALNDPFEPIRQEVVKVLINRVVAVKSDSQPPQDSPVLAIFDVLKNSRFADVHQVALDEWQARLRQSVQPSDTHLAMLGEFLASPFASIRDKAFDIASQEPKRIAVERLLALAFASPFVDVRKRGLSLLEARLSPALLALLPALFNDENAELRLQALNLAITTHQTQADNDQAVLAQALSSPYSDIQLATATALAQQGNLDNRLASLAIFEQFLAMPKPELADEQALWQRNVEQALNGLATLGNANTDNEQKFDWFDRYLFDPKVNGGVNFGNNPALLGQVYRVATPATPAVIDRLQVWQKDERKPVSQAASLALAILGVTTEEQSGLPATKQASVFSHLTGVQQLQAHIGLGIKRASAVRLLLEKQDTRLLAWLVLAFHDLLQHPAQPELLIETLAFADNETAFLSAGVVSRYADSASAWQFIADYLNQTFKQARLAHKTKTEQDWQLTVPVLQRLAQLVVYAPPLLKADTVTLLAKFAGYTPPTFAHWQSLYHNFERQHHDQLAFIVPLAMVTPPELETQRGKKAIDPSYPSQQHWQALAFGAWLGILRQTDYHNLNVGMQALRALTQLANDYPNWRDSVERALIPLLNHPNQLRELAWQSLVALGTPAERLGEQAMSSPHVDIVQKGLALWLTTHSEQEADQQLQHLLQTNSPVLTQEAYRLLVKRVGAVKAGEWALSAYYLPLREQVVNEWRQVTASERQADKKYLLSLATDNDDWQTRYNALSQLLTMDINNDLFAKTQQLWQQSPDALQQRLANRLLLDTVKNFAKQGEVSQLLPLLDSPHRKIDINQVYEVLGESRATELVPRLLERYRNPVHSNERADIVKTLTKISGFDQVIEDYHDEQADKRWLERQYPRHVGVLINLAQSLLQNTDYLRFNNLLNGLAWANDESFNAQIDSLLQRAYTQLPSQHTAGLVKAMAYRAEKRHSDLTGLRKALSNRDPLVQFLAAEGLAKRGVKDGFAILMATIDYNTEGDLRRRAVLALGELADEQAYDKLIKLADDPEHYLQDVASEALGHLGQSEHGQRILQLLVQHLQDVDNENPAIKHWVNGLRYFDSVASWQAIRDFIVQHQHEVYRFWESVPVAVDCLRHHVAEDAIGKANRDFVLQLITTSDDDEIVEHGFNAAQYLFGNEPTEVYPYDWATLKSQYPTIADNLSINRISKYANLDQLLDFIADYPVWVQHQRDKLSDWAYQQASETALQTLTQAVLNRDNLPSDRLQRLLISPTAINQQLALRYLTQQPTVYWQDTVEATVWQQLQHSQHQWQILLDQVNEQPSLMQQSRWRDNVKELADLLAQQLWLVGRYANTTTFATVLQWLIEQSQQLIVQNIPTLSQAINHALQQGLLAVLARLTATASNDKDIRWLNVLQRVNYWATPELAELAQAIQQKAQMTSPIATDPQDPYQQLMRWVQEADTTALLNLANNAQANEGLRISAIEAVAQLPLDTERTQTILAGLQHLQQHDSDSDIQKAAFRALRRVERRLQPKSPKHSTTDLNVI